jgi:thiol-disulfide isomerase/thioredoxin
LQERDEMNSTISSSLTGGLLASAGVALAVVLLLTLSGRPAGDTAADKGPLAPELAGGQGWINSEPLTLADLRGKVVLVDFWTYGCINCRNTLPAMRAWWEKYKDQGLVIVGVHTPEFPFEYSAVNVRKATQKLDITWPVVQDNDYRIWNAYRNRYWPHFYLIDKQGRIVYDHIGEGAYAETEHQIEAALAQ